MLTEKDYCDYDTCVALKELGFNQYNSIRYYAGVGGVKLWDFDGEPNYKEGELIALNDLYDVPRDGNEVAAPSLYEAQKWLRKEKGIHIAPRIYLYHDINLDEQTSWECTIYVEWSAIYTIGKSLTYEDALLLGIKEAVKILKEKLNEET